MLKLWDFKHKTILEDVTEIKFSITNTIATYI